MDTDRPPHRSTSNISSTATTSTANTTSELFICFTSRLSSSSSMKIPSKSILSPGRARDSSQISLSTSLSRRLRNSGSMKGGQASPMFPATNGKKRGCSFENPEPSSPKVTCIGQVRVKTKKQGKKIRARSRREVSFRRAEQGTNINSTSTNSSHHNLDGNHYQDFGHMGHQFQQAQECLPHRNQRWVHLPVTICEALRAFGAEFNCFLPCRSSCTANNNNEREKEGKLNPHPKGSESSCGAVFARWLVAEKIELVVEEEEERNDEDDVPRRSQRRHVFEDIVIEGDNKCEQKNEILQEEEGEEEEEEEEEGRMSICIPPKNALLLMRCRSDPVKMAALANRFWECSPPQDEEAQAQAQAQDVIVNENENEVVEEEGSKKVKAEQERQVSSEKLVFSDQIIEEDKIADAEAIEEAEIEAKSKEINQAQEGEIQKQVQEEEKQVLNQPVLEEEAVPSDSYTEALSDPDYEQNTAKLQENENVLEDKQGFDDNENKRASIYCSSEVFLLPELESQEDRQRQEADVTVAEDSTEEKEKEEEEEETETIQERSETEDPETGKESKEGESQKENLLPDCLLLMMCEPKLSMEVSRETWVCSTDFIRWKPPEKKPVPQIVNKTDDCDEQPKKRVSIDAVKPTQQKHQLLMQPPRSSCSFPAAPPLPPALGAPSVKTMNTMIEQKLVGAKLSSYEPLALTRCKSEPRKPSAKLAPDTCFWKNRKIEPHGPSTFGVGAAGVGF